MNNFQASFFLLIILILLHSCKKNKDHKQKILTEKVLDSYYYSSGNIKYETYRDNNLIIDSIFYYYDTLPRQLKMSRIKLKDSLFKYYSISKDRKVITFGNEIFLNGHFQQIGWFKVINKEKIPIKFSELEYVRIGDTTLLNQDKYFIDDILQEKKSNFITINYSTEIKENEVEKFNIKLNYDTTFYKPIAFLCLSNEFAENFANIEDNGIKIDTFSFNEHKANTFMWNINTKFGSKGKKKIRGFILLESWDNIVVELQDSLRLTRHSWNIYFERKINVVP